MTANQIRRIADFNAAVVTAGISSGVDNIDLHADTWPPTPTVVWNQSATPQQQTAWANLLATWSWTLKQPRSLLAIYNDLVALTPTQQANVWNNLLTILPTYTGTSAGSLWALYSEVVDVGLVNPALAKVKGRAAALYVLDNPRYLEHPAFDTTINISGDENEP